ncbi:MAG: hypothetical protein EZS26_000506 [Candidatus Ordinivivax streblomastigis]|uniref:FAS1 domain-containing protein n=1 Tax=Candidatus Ordinivivax streblomastigis TaxID=2540710 RepID=A0A5M8P4V7_9BACT|nr:MAG: hypothetical protein EZS26_000461 [Candidatus Ordinivivax streblomastigis]KAA6303346.1 MAG: hypothetical protein EZS26_000506 [Candidatus Ordinivivax streblomastigis]
MKYIACFLSLLLWVVSFQSCQDIAEGDAAITFHDELVTSFLEKNPEQYSDFLGLMHATGMADLLNAYGNYTCFIPTNAAMRDYYEKNEIASSADMTDEDKFEFVYNHIVSAKSPDDVYFSSRFPKDELPILSLSNRPVSIRSVVDSIRNKVQIFINESSPIIILDQKVHNGVIHTLGRVMTSSKIQLPGVIDNDPRFSLFSRALKETGLERELMVSQENEVYVANRKLVDPNGTGVVSKAGSQSNEIKPTPAICNIEFTALIESDETYQAALSAAGFTPDYEGLKQYAASIYGGLYPNDRGITDITNRNNSFNRFIAYHLLNMRISYGSFLGQRASGYTEGYVETAYSEYLEPLCQNTLMEVRPAAMNQKDIPVFNKRRGDKGVRIIASYCNKEAKNGLYHEIDRVLTYEGLSDELQVKRIRMDATTLLPEMTTNLLRGNTDKSGGQNRGWVIPQGFFQNLTYTEETQMQYWGKQASNVDWDELLFAGKYDFTLRLPPVPAGTYELRIGYTANTKRGVAQIFLDHKPCGIPLDLTVTADKPDIGWKSDASLKDPESIAENDKMMRNRGYMKGPGGADPNRSSTIRNNSSAVRKIIYTGYLDNKPHLLQIKSVEKDRSDREFMLDYIEFAPRAIWENEDTD